MSRTGAPAEEPGGVPLSLVGDVERAAQALLRLAEQRPALVGPLARTIAVLAEEATRSSRFATALTRALIPDADVDLPSPAPRRSGRRAPGPLDPFAVYAEHGEPGLRQRLQALELEQLRDVVAEHGMDHDRLAMKWKDSARVADRIVERVIARAAKGSAFRTSPP